MFQIAESSRVFKRHNKILKRLEKFQQGELYFRNYSYKKKSRIIFQPLGVFNLS